MTEGGNRTDARHDVSTITDKGRLFRQWLHIGKHGLMTIFGRRADTLFVGPKVVFLLAEDVACLGKGRLALLHQAANMVAVHMGQNHNGHVVRRITGRG